MFMVNEGEAALIRDAYERGGELLAGAELCRLFPGLTDQVQARLSARAIAGWRPIEPPTELAPGRSRRRQESL
jgi:hypothetical protein